MEVYDKQRVALCLNCLKYNPQYFTLLHRAALCKIV